MACHVSHTRGPSAGRDETHFTQVASKVYDVVPHQLQSDSLIQDTKILVVQAGGIWESCPWLRDTHLVGIWPGRSIPLVWNPPLKVRRMIVSATYTTTQRVTNWYAHPVQKIATGSNESLVALAGVQMASFKRSSVAKGALMPAELLGAPQLTRYCGICWFHTVGMADTYCGHEGG